MNAQGWDAQLWLWIAAASCLGLAAVATLAERRRTRRRDPDRVGWVPWGGVTLLALFGFAAAVAFALRG